MLKYINYQLDENTAQQVQLEQDVASSINRTFTANMAAFKQFIPSVLDIVQQHQVQKYSVFCNLHGELNAVDFATGRVLYGQHPYQEISDEVDSFCQLAPYFDLDAEPRTEHDSWRCEALPASIDAIVVFGLGMGYQLNLLLQQVRVKYIIVYEPSVDYLFCSLQANDWAQLFELAAGLGTQIFLQLGNDGSSLQSDLSELCQATPQQRFYVYRHYFHPVMDKVIHFAMQHSGQKQTLLQGNQHFDSYKHFYDYVGERNPNVLGNLEPQSSSKNDVLYEKNMAAIAHFYPQVHKAIQKHSAAHWQLVVDDKQQQNLYHLERRALFYQDCAAESEQVIDYFTHHPYKDDVILGQKITRKLRHYLHFSQMQKIQPILSKSLQSKSLLPEQVESLIIFGVALGKHIEVLTKQHQIKNLYICEPNLDFFLASLYVTDWADILQRADEAECRVYLNLGGDGSRYFYDLMSQFYQVGAYSIANTYMLSSYFNETMQQAIYDLRSELKVVLAIGEYFDHARYGLAHTYRSLADGHRFFKQANKGYADHAATQLPVFVVGNGPSLDQSFDYLKEYQHKAIIISCGTALQALHRHGICPDFHAEIEQNRATYDWISQVQDPSYLKQIRLLSVNGIHPDTAALFKETLLCFKDGEASTYVFQNGLAKHGIQIASLSYAYPTVTNLVVNTMLKLGYRMLYLFGVDLGFSDINYHHSKSSAYYKKDGTEVYNYQKAHGGGVPAAGNFRPQVFTKPEFDVSRKLLEQAIKAHRKQLEIYNCSDGVRIAGTVSLQPANILLPSLEYEKSALLEDFIAAACYTELEPLGDKIFNQFSIDAFTSTMTEWLALLHEPANTAEEAMTLIKQQWLLLRDSVKDKRNPSYLLMSGSTNYISAVLTKLAVSMDDASPDIADAFNEVLTIWREYIEKASADFSSEPLQLDGVSVQYLMSRHQS